MLVRRNISGLAAVAMVALVIAALVRRRFRLGFFLFHVAVALGERWSEGRARHRVARVLAADATFTHPALPEYP